MNIAEAKQELMDLSQGTYHSLEYQIDDHGNGNVRQTCKVYMDKHGSFSASHWEEALQSLKDTIEGKPTISEDIPLSVKTK